MMMSPDVWKSAGRDVGVDDRDRILHRRVHWVNLNVTK